MTDLLAPLVVLAEEWLVIFILIFVRIGAVVGLAPAFGEVVVPARVRLGAAFAVALLVAPAIDPSAVPNVVTPDRFVALLLTEAAIGLGIGLAVRLVVHALQYAGSIAGQSTALTQIAGINLAPDPMPAIGNALMIAGLALAMVLGLHIKLVAAVIGSYETLGFGAALPGSDVALWGVSQAAAAAALGFTLAAPFLIAALLYNIALGAINRAMPQLMVAFVGAPAITGGTLVLFFLAGPLMLSVWHDRLDAALEAPFDPR